MTEVNEDMKQEVMDFLGDETPEGFVDDPIEEFDDDIFEPPEEASAEEASGEGEEEHDEVTPEEQGAATDGVPAVESEESAPAEVAQSTEPAEEDSALAALQAQNKQLLEQFEELQGKIAEMQKPAEPETPAAVAQVPSIAQQSADGVIDFVGEADLDEILSDKNQFNAFLSNVVQQVQTSTTENIYRNLPSMVQNHVASQQKITTYVDEFYKENSDLVGVKKTVGAVANEVASEHPEMQLEQIFQETATRVRNMLGLVKKANAPRESANPAVGKPALPVQGARRSGTTATKLTGQEKHIQDVL